MKCPDGMLRCENCGQDVRIVPDYNPLDDVLEAQVKGSMDGTSTPLDDYEYKAEVSHSDRRRRNAGSTTSGRRTSTGKNGANQTERERRRRQAERRKALRRKRRRMVLGILFVFLILSGVLLYVLYQNSYAGQVKKGNKAALEQNFDEAIAYYQRA